MFCCAPCLVTPAFRLCFNPCVASEFETIRRGLRLENVNPTVEIYDTTLRDGSPGEGTNFSAMNKRRIADKLDAFGIHFIEDGLRPGLSAFCRPRTPQG